MRKTILAVVFLFGCPELPSSEETIDQQAEEVIAAAQELEASAPAQPEAPEPADPMAELKAATEEFTRKGEERVKEIAALKEQLELSRAAEQKALAERAMMQMPDELFTIKVDATLLGEAIANAVDQGGESAPKYSLLEFKSSPCQACDYAEVAIVPQVRDTQIPFEQLDIGSREARRLKVNETPTFVLLLNGREVARSTHMGVLDMLKKHQPVKTVAGPTFAVRALIEDKIGQSIPIKGEVSIKIPENMAWTDKIYSNGRLLDLQPNPTFSYRGIGIPLVSLDSVLIGPNLESVEIRLGWAPDVRAEIDWSSP